MISERKRVQTLEWIIFLPKSHRRIFVGIEEFIGIVLECSSWFCCICRIMQINDIENIYWILDLWKKNFFLKITSSYITGIEEFIRIVLEHSSWFCCRIMQINDIENINNMSNDSWSLEEKFFPQNHIVVYLKELKNL